MSLPAPQQAAIAVNRFGLGARPDEPLPTDPRRWLLAQMDRFDPRPAPIAAIGSGTAMLHALYAGRRENQEAHRTKGPLGADSVAQTAQPGGLAATPLPANQAVDALVVARRAAHDRYRAAVNARMAAALATDAPFAERLVAFWSNHFALSMEKVQVASLAPDFEFDVIRRHVLGRFSDMLLAVEHHPAMLIYLDQDRSIGPGSVASQRAMNNTRQQRGLNENLAREIMELHTLGARSGYSQADVTEFARALTGWNVGGLRPDAGTEVSFAFRPNQHEPGRRTILGQAFDQPGEAQARAIQLALAASPATARHISTKLARHFVADDPPPALVERLTAAFLQSGGDLPILYRALVTAPESWARPVAKFKTPWDWTASALRGIGRRDVGSMDMAPLLTQLGQPVWKPGQPIGYDDLSASWAAPDALMRRVEAAQRFAAAVGPDLDARRLAPQLLPGTLTPATQTEIARAESRPTALALLLVSPEFQRR